MRERFTTLIVVIVLGLDIYWLVVLIVGPRNVSSIQILAGLVIQLAGIGGLIAAASRFKLSARIPVGACILAAFLGSAILWKGLFHADEARSSPSIWRSQQQSFVGDA